MKGGGRGEEGEGRVFHAHPHTQKYLRSQKGVSFEPLMTISDDAHARTQGPGSLALNEREEEGERKGRKGKEGFSTPTHTQKYLGSQQEVCFEPLMTISDDAHALTQGPGSLALNEREEEGEEGEGSVFHTQPT